MKLFRPTGIVLVMLSLMYLITYVDRVNVSTAAAGFAKDFDLNKTQIGIGEGGKDQSDLGLGKVELLTEARRRGADIDPVDIGDQVHERQHHQHDAGGAKELSHMFSPAL